MEDRITDVLGIDADFWILECESIERAARPTTGQACIVVRGAGVWQDFRPQMERVGSVSIVHI